MTRVLIADDDAELLQSLVKLLEVVGYETVGAPSGIAALEAAKHWRPHVTILDLDMPGATGLEVATLLGCAGGRKCQMFLP